MAKLIAAIKDKTLCEIKLIAIKVLPVERKKTVTELFSFQFQSQIKNVSPKGLLIIFVKIAGLV